MAKASGIDGFYASKYVQRIEAGQAIPTALDYPVQSWTLGDDLAIVFLGGEVTVDYSVRLKSLTPSGKLWVAAYSNDVRTYIPSARVLQEGGYEGGGSRIFDHFGSAATTSGMASRQELADALLAHRSKRLWPGKAGFAIVLVSYQQALMFFAEA
ncbi:hypothetical protein [Blastopirellula retiformator]|uniref:Uncharacterized protein n=1 Tax=Blastopirellula retiformator TaxID=2527970 RepID=A0A5C5V3V3_9BACT|nr:hypothetical protein [Blastopirellula retiformator]TWT33244.1 hypothetical protein Enr8_30690 [Blastopirellula retiformator]